MKYRMKQVIVHDSEGKSHVVWHVVSVNGKVVAGCYSERMAQRIARLLDSELEYRQANRRPVPGAAE